MADPSPNVLREFDDVARRAIAFSEALEKNRNSLPNTFPGPEIEKICKTLADLPRGTTQGGREQLDYAKDRLPDVRGEFFQHDVITEDRRAARDETLDQHFALLIASVATAISSIDREAGQRPPDEPPAIRYEIDPSDRLIAEAMTAGDEAETSLNILADKLAYITKPASEAADYLRRRVSDGIGLVSMARADLGFHRIVPQWTRKLGKAIEKIPAGLRKAADGIDLAVDIAKSHIEQWSEVKRDIREVAFKHIRLFAENLRKNADRLEKKQSGGAQTGQLDQPPPDFDVERVKELVIKGERVPEAWRPWVFELDLSGTQITDATPLKDLTNLTRLGLINTGITDATPLKDLTNLTGLSLGFTKITDATPLKGLTNLTELNLRGTQIADATPLKDLTNLTWLDLDGTQITDATPLKDLTNLTGLYLNNTPITNFRPLKELNNLKEIFIESVARAKRIRNQLGRTWHVSKHEIIGYKLSRDLPNNDA
jgi:hypothetical protein